MSTPVTELALTNGEPESALGALSPCFTRGPALGLAAKCVFDGYMQQGLKYEPGTRVYYSVYCRGMHGYVSGKRHLMWTHTDRAEDDYKRSSLPEHYVSCVVRIVKQKELNALQTLYKERMQNCTQKKSKSVRL